MKRVMISNSGQRKIVKEGISWTYFFFGFFVPFFRKDIKYGFITLSLDIILEVLDYLAYGVSLLNIVIIFLKLFFYWYFILNYNKLYIKELLKKGYHFEDEDFIIDSVL